MSKQSHSGSSRVATINAVRTPLGFLVLGLLVAEGGLLGGAVVGLNQAVYFTVAVAVALAYALVVAGLAVWQPEALSGLRPLQVPHANQLATDLFLALDGSLRNLSSAERREAWVVAADMITSSNTTESVYAEFCRHIADKLRSLADNIHSRPLPGPAAAGGGARTPDRS